MDPLPRRQRTRSRGAKLALCSAKQVFKEWTPIQKVGSGREIVRFYDWNLE